MTQNSQICATCSIEKPLSAFHRRNDRPNGRVYSCRLCLLSKLRKQRWAPPTLSEAEWGYIAGMMDGEGSISLSQNTMNGIRRYLQIRIYNTNLESLRWIHAKLGGNICLTHKPRESYHRQGYFWYMAMRSAWPTLERLLPMLIIKRRHAEVAIAFCARVEAAKNEAREVGTSVCVDRDAQLAALDAELRLLNGRGARRDLLASKHR